MKKTLLLVGFLAVIGITCVAYAGQMHRSQAFCDIENCTQTRLHEHNQYECNIENCPRTKQYIDNTCNRNTCIRQENCYNTAESGHHHGRKENHHGF